MVAASIRDSPRRSHRLSVCTSRESFLKRVSFGRFRRQLKPEEAENYWISLR
ncbi:hypothetical protein KCP75_16980 [Salmonella enterica subsp. enterica]|nr:hypothetical protein KCP75_16980 [Salmonella enterica subsp. enterica]